MSAPRSGRHAPRRGVRPTPRRPGTAPVRFRAAACPVPGPRGGGAQPLPGLKGRAERPFPAPARARPEACR